MTSPEPYRVEPPDTEPDVDLDLLPLDWRAVEIPPGTTFADSDEQMIPGWYVTANDAGGPEDADPSVILYVSNVEGGPPAVAAFATDLAAMLNEHASVMFREPTSPTTQPDPTQEGTPA